MNNFNINTTKQVYNYTFYKKNNAEINEIKDLILDKLIEEIEKNNSKYFSKEIKENIV